ncbi:DUF1735 and LamG domain-containing protein [Sphingobacterium spiritivorum]|uniref:DUF1735 and LamG domain-containing protein n=1 Tax=Sphingobacterium spiritivorum TaxID=258 RepID=UPI003DA2C4D3
MKSLYIYIQIMLLSVLAFSIGCKNEEIFSNNVFNAVPKVENLLIKSTLISDERKLQASIARPETRDVNITYDVDASLVEKYNAAYYDKAIMLPKENYRLPQASALIPAGSVKSNDVTIYFDKINELDRDQIYVLPVTIASADIDILQSARTTYYVLKGAALINVVADLEENYLHINQWANAGVVNNLSEITMETLIRARNYDRMISSVMGIEGRFLIRLGDAGFPSNQIQVATNSGNFPGGDSNKGLPSNEWVHIAVTYSRTSRAIKIYVNGKVQSEGTLSLAPISLGVNGQDGFYIGRSYADDRFFAGEFAECRIWNVVRTEEEIAGNPYEVDPKSAGLVAYWKCNEGAGNTVQDYTGNGNNLTAKAGKDIKWTPVSLPAKK